MRVDLHIHTTASDGCWTPERVVAGVRAEGIELFAVADHDSVGSVRRVEELAHEAGIAFLRGTEISTIEEGALFHILGYGIDLENPALWALLRENRAKLEATDDRDVQQLIKMGLPLDYEEYRAYDYDRTRGGFKSLNFLVDKGYCTGPRDFFDRIRSQLNHYWPDFPPPAVAAAVIRKAGGVPVLAHPGASLRNHGGVTEETLAPFLGRGIGGMECYSQYHDEATTAFCVEWCVRHDLLVTGGSDYHGGFVGRQLGIPMVDTSQLRLGPLEKVILR